MAVAALVQQVIDNFDGAYSTTAKLYDLKNAFDCVDHPILLQKLSHYGIRGLPLHFFESYLGGRSQIVFFDNKASRPAFTPHGVPQGSILGPILFSIFVNDFSGWMSPSETVQYADDTTIFSKCRKEEDIDAIKTDMSARVELWFQSNRLLINAQKTQEITFTSDRTRQSGNVVSLLGFALDESLNWRSHIESLETRLSSRLFMLRQLSECLPKTALLRAYYGLFNSLMAYGVGLWGLWQREFSCFRRVPFVSL